MKKYLLIAFFLLLSNLKINAQTCNADFLVVTDNCPLIVFTDQSTSDTDTITGWNYDFGDGFTSTSQNTEHSYESNGKFEVCLTITTDDDCTVTICDSVTIDCIVEPSCEAGFQYAMDGCGIIYFDEGSVSSGTVTNWSYDFGDGNTSSETNPVHAFTENGIYEVCQTIETDDGCSSTFCDTIEIDCIVTPECDAMFLMATDNCPMVTFFDQSVSVTGTITGWNYDFGDGSTSTSKNSVHNYESNGKYEVCLTIETDDGCSGTYCDSVIVDCIYVPTCEAGFQYAMDGCGIIYFDEGSVSSGTVVEWFYDFGDGTTSEDPNPVHTFVENGKYEVCQSIGTDDGCVSTLCDTVEIDCIVTPECNAMFLTATDNCPIVAFFDQSVSEPGNIEFWKYDFGDGTTSTSRNSVHTYESNGKYEVCLVIETDDGCRSTYCDSVTIDCVYVPTCGVGFQFVSDSCGRISFDESSESSGTVTSWLYDFGDGNFSDDANPVHTYPENGKYEVCLTIETDEGCTSSFCDSVEIDCIVIPECEASFVKVTDNCPIVAFFDQSVSGTGEITNWLYDFGDGTTTSSKNAVHTYESNGKYEVCLTIETNDGCTSTFCDSILVDCINNPICFAAFQFAMDGCGIIYFDEGSESSGTVTSWTYDFGDGNTSEERNPVHTYTENGEYVACLTIETDDGCTSTYCDTIEIGCIVIPECDANFMLIDDNCPMIAFFDQSVSEPGNIVAWKYDFGDGTTSTSKNSVHNYETNGRYEVCLTIETNDGCRSTYCDSVMVDCVYEPTCGVGFQFVSDSCGRVMFDESSESSGTVTSWNYDFGDGSSSSDANPVHTYSENGTYKVCLTIETDEGCTSSYCEEIEIDCIEIPVQADFTVSSDNCPIIVFLNQSEIKSGKIISYYYDFGDGFSSNSQNSIHTYTSGGKFQVCLTVTIDDGNSHTYCDSVSINCLTTGAEIFDSGELEIYPNPVKTKLQLRIPYLSEIQYRIYGINGQVFKEGEKEKENHFEIDVANLVNGVYFIEVKADREIRKMKFIKQ